MNLQNKLVPPNHPRRSGIHVTPHPTVFYSTKTRTREKSKDLFSNSTLPTVISSVNYHGKEIKDPAMTMVLKKQSHEARRTLLRNRLTRKELPDSDIISTDMIDYIELNRLDPAPHINDEFDWHFSGGNLDVVDIHGTKRLAQSSMTKESALRILVPTTKFDHMDLKKVDSKSLEKNYGYEIMQNEQLIGIRRRKTINFLHRSELNFEEVNFRTPIKFKWLSEIAASALSHRVLMLIDVKNNLIQTNVDRFIAEEIIKLPSRPDQQFPVSLGFLNEHVVSYTDLKSMNIVDLRVGKVNKVFEGDKNFVLNCEEIVYHKKSLHDNLMYLASSHLLYGLDLRNPRDLLLQWTHQLELQPTKLKQVMFKSHEVICLSSNMQGDLKIFNCSKGKLEDSWRVNWVPLKPRTIKQSYHRVRSKGVCLLSDPIKHRVDLSTTGVAMIADEENSTIQLFTQNSLGDVFKSHLSNDHDHDKEVKVKRLMKSFYLWDKILQVDHHQQDPLKIVPLEERPEFTDIVKLKGLGKVMRCERLQAAFEEEPPSQMGVVRVPRWKTNLEDEKEYQDALSQHILAEWDLQIEDTQPQLFAEALKASGINLEDGLDRVSMWLEESELEKEIVKEEEEEVVDVTQITGTQCFTQTSTQPTDAARKSQKVSKRVKGF